MATKNIANIVQKVKARYGYNKLQSELHLLFVASPISSFEEFAGKPRQLQSPTT